MEETLYQVMDTGEIVNEADSEDTCSSYDLRTRVVVKQSRKRHLYTETFNSDTGKSYQFDKNEGSFNNESVGKNQYICGENIDVENFSQESVSMLEGLYQNHEFPELTETCMNSEFEVISIHTDDEFEQTDEEDTVLRVEKSTQTNFEGALTKLTQSREIEMAKHVNFIKSVVKLKALLSSKEPIPGGKIWSLLQNTIKGGEINEESSEIEQTIPKETIGYIIRSSDVENVFCETVKIVLQYLDCVFEEDFLSKASCWKDSVYEMAVTMLSEAVDCEVGVWKMVDSFLCDKIGSVLKDGGKSKNLVLESKTNVLISFCQSAHLSYTATNFIIRKLEKLKLIKPNVETLREKISRAHFTKNSYFLLRILESSLEILKGKIARGKADETPEKKSTQENYNVLEMWKKHWNKNKVSEGKKSSHDWEVVVSQWCTDLDEVLMHCVNYIPVLSMAVERCGLLAKEILKLFHGELMVDKTEKTVLDDQKIKKLLNLD